LVAYVIYTALNFALSWSPASEVKGDSEQVQIVGFSGKLPISDSVGIKNFPKYYPVLFDIAAPSMNIFMILCAFFVEKQKGQQNATSVT
jgi:hypothetical protein